MDGYNIFVNQRCPKLNVAVGSCNFNIAALVFDMGHLDVVLGMEWLKTLVMFTIGNNHLCVFSIGALPYVFKVLLDPTRHRNRCIPYYHR